MMILKVMLLAFCVGTYEACPTITAWHGRFISTGDIKGCSFLMNGVTVDPVQVQSMRAYGLLQVSCDDCAFSLVSDFQSCDDCFICEHNERIKGCQSVLLPVVVGLLVSFIVILVLCVVWCALPRRITDYPLHSLIAFITKKKEAKKGKKEMKMHKRVMSVLDTLTPVAASAPPEPATNLYPTLELTNETAPREKPLRPMKRTNSNSTLNGAMTAALLMSLMNPTSACDAQLYLSSTGGLYEDNIYSTVSTSLTSMHVGSTICMQHHNGSVESISLVSAELIEYYKPIYKACDFSLQVQSHYSCLGSGLCWSPEHCHRGARLEAVGSLAYKVPSTQTGCKLVPNMAGAGCTHRQICMWYAWELSPKYDSCDIISKLSGDDVMLHFSYTTAIGDIIPFTLSRSDPVALNPVIIHLVSLQLENVQTFPNIRQHGRLSLGTHAANLNMGQPGVLGDLQIPLINESDDDPWSYPMWSIRCDVDTDKYFCDTSNSGYNNSLRADSNNVISVSSTEMTVVRKREIKVYGSIMFRAPVGVDHLIKSASCDFSVVSTYGCTGCTDPSFVIISASNVRSTGLVPFESDCDFFLKEVACSSTPQRLPLVGSPRNCTLRIKNSNQTLSVIIDYKFLGQVYSMGISTFASVPTVSVRTDIIGFVSYINFPLLISIHRVTVDTLQFFWSFEPEGQKAINIYHNKVTYRHQNCNMHLI